MAVHFCIPSITHADAPIANSTMLRHLHGAAVSHAVTHMTNLCCLFSFIKTHMHTTNPSTPLPNTHRCRHKHKRFFLLLSSQLCSDIKQSPLRENKHADEERLAGHRAAVHTHTNTHTVQLRVLLEGKTKLSDLSLITKSYMNRPQNTTVKVKPKKKASFILEQSLESVFILSIYTDSTVLVKSTVVCRLLAVILIFVFQRNMHERKHFSLEYVNSYIQNSDYRKVRT